MKGSSGFYYLGSFTFNRSKAVESVAFGGGRIRKTGTNTYAVDYYITDHLGSVRAIVNASGTIQEQNDYYPFGTRHANGLTQLTANRWRYNGKEDQVTGSIGYLDYGARFYDPVIARWNKIDPRADEQQKFSPYSFCGGNPILHIDTDGEILETAWDVASLVMGVQSFVSNVKQGKVGAAIVDGIGIIGDAFAVAAPIIPGGISAGVAAVRVGKNIDHAVDAAKALDHGMDITRKAAGQYEKLQNSAKIGKEAHRQIEAEIKMAFPDANIEHTMRIGGKRIRKDAILPDGTMVIIKPDTPSGHLSAKKREQLLRENNFEKIETIFYDPSNPRWEPGSPTYIGPKNN